MPAGADRELLEVGDRIGSDRARHLGVELPRMDERAVDAGRNRAVETADHDPVDRLRWIRRRDPEHGDAPSGVGQQLPHRRHATVAAPDERDLVGPRHAAREVEDAVLPRIRPGHEGRPGRKRHGRRRRAQHAAGAARHQRGERGHVAGLEKRPGEVPRRPVETDDRDHGRVSARTRAPAGALRWPRRSRCPSIRRRPTRRGSGERSCRR